MCERCAELEAQCAAMRAVLERAQLMDCLTCEQTSELAEEALAADAGREWLETAREVTAALEYLIRAGKKRSNRCLECHDVAIKKEGLVAKAEALWGKG